MKFIFGTILLLLTQVQAWTPPIFLDTMRIEEVSKTDDNGRGLQQQNGTPTASPTESPAPSPSPSEFPTSRPTKTAKPTGTPTANPTESPAPSPSPSEIPTTSPSATPTGAPSASPTTTTPPTTSPTTSRAPSPTPTSVPSATPSSAPSGSPSATPTFVHEITASFMVEFDFENILAIGEANAFEAATSTWVSFYPVGSGSIDDVNCDVYNQVLKTRATTKVESDGSDGEPEKYLQIFFLIQVMYTGADKSFNLFNLLDSQFQNQNTNWIRALADEDTVFQRLLPVSQNLVDNIGDTEKSDISGGRTSLSKTSYTGILLVSFFALILAIYASIYAIRSHNLNTFGTELRSPNSKGLGDSSVNYVGSTHQHGIQHHQHQQNLYSNQIEPRITKSTSSENSARPPIPVPEPHSKQTKSNNHRLSNQSETSIRSQHPKPPLPNGRRTSLQGKLPPPPQPLPPSTNDSPKKRKEKDPIAHRLSELREPPAFSEVNFGRESSLFDRQSIASEASDEDDLYVPNRISDTMAERIAKFEKNSVVSDNGQEMKLTKSFGGTLGARSISNAGSTSDISSQAKAFFDNLVQKTAEQMSGKTSARGSNLGSSSGKPAQGLVGARPLVQEKMAETEKRRVSYDSVLRKPGLYDVFAPPGPIGIVVDTTDNGPAVHSLKNTSPMIGLIAPGDLIVGLDDQDTRGMTAATLTRLMAHKANQKERKITLLTVDGYY